MKELSIEEKAKRYDEIIKKANKMHHENCEACQACIEELIPELAESEDERIRKELICFLETEIPQCNARDKYIAWLEKREQKPAEWSSEQSKTLQTDNVSYKSSTDTHLWTRAIGFDGESMESKPCEQNTWSEEDEKMLEYAINMIEWYSVVDKRKSRLVSAWLKSLKERYTWKPSEGQLECLGYAIDKAEKDWSPLTNNRIYLTLKALKEQLLELKGSKV